VRFVDRLLLVSKIRQRAREAWKSVCQASPDHPYSSDYADGFEAGFRDFVEAGGTGEPPGMPPPCYRLSCNAGPGRQALLDWYAGFRHGAAVARENGLRQAILIPVGGIPEGAIRHMEPPLALPPDHQPPGPLVPDQGQQDPAGLIRAPSSPSASPLEVLPKPRKSISP
jgi:hypothetical protein